jgi:hypothetical protein
MAKIIYKIANEVGNLFTTNGKDVWRLISYCEFPSVEFENLETKERTGGAVGSPHINGFKRLKTEE